jgi:hypothetical protein
LLRHASGPRKTDQARKRREAAVYSVQGGGHVWPNSYDVSKFDASSAIADFLLAHPLSGGNGHEL